MSAPATIPFSQPETRTEPQPASPPWAPTDRDRLIFQWVKFEGHTQSWVAQQLEMNQSTVSRIVERYERWIARGGPRQQGGLSNDERLRAQRWLTYERNEWILASALRIAGEMEHAIDTSKSTITRPASRPSQETEIRTEHQRLDRSGMVARYLRLAYRVNMEQLKLVEQEPLAELEPLTIDEAEELARSRQPLAQDEPDQAPADAAHQDESLRASVPLCETPSTDWTTAGDAPAIADELPMHSVHNDQTAEPCPSADAATLCAEIATAKKPSTDAYPWAPTPPELAHSLYPPTLAPSP